MKIGWKALAVVVTCFVIAVLLHVFMNQRHRNLQLAASSGRNASRVSLGYSLILLSTIGFIFIVCVNSSPYPNSYFGIQFTAREIPFGVVWADYENYQQFSVFTDINVEAWIDSYAVLKYNFSTVPIHVRVTNVGNLTVPDFRSDLLIVDDTGRIIASDQNATQLSATGNRITEYTFFYNVPQDFRGKELSVRCFDNSGEHGSQEEHDHLENISGAQTKRVPKNSSLLLYFQHAPGRGFCTSQ